MNNVYYRFLQLVEDDEYSKPPARLRMNVIGSPGITKADFELVSLAVSAVNGCGRCVTAHERILRQHEVGREAVQSVVRIASVMHALLIEGDAPLHEYEGVRPLRCVAPHHLRPSLAQAQDCAPHASAERGVP